MAATVVQVSPIASLVHHCFIAVVAVVVCGVALVALVVRVSVAQETLLELVLLHHLRTEVLVVVAVQMPTEVVATEVPV
jgi:hypothetical protein